MTRSPSKRITNQNDSKSNTNAPPKNICTQKILCLKEKLCSKSLQILNLKHPKTKESVPCLMNLEDKEAFEITTYDEGFRSWFVDNSTLSNGNFYISTKLDLTYFILPYLIKAKQKVPLDHMLEDDDFPSMVKLAEIVGDLSHVATMKGGSSLKVWCYDEKLTLSWLEKRCHKLGKVLKQKRIPLTNGAQFQRSFDESDEELAYISMGHGILSEYLPDSIEELLRKHLKIPDPANKQNSLENAAKQKASEPAKDMPKAKKPKIEEPSEDYSSKEKTFQKAKTNSSAKDKALAKSASGSKNIMSFFGKR